jgi:hypothetical protein
MYYEPLPEQPMGILGLVNAQLTLVDDIKLEDNVLRPPIDVKVDAKDYYVVMPSGLDYRKGVRPVNAASVDAAAAPPAAPAAPAALNTNYLFGEKFSIYTLKHFLETYGYNKDYSKNSNTTKLKTTVIGPFESEVRNRNRNLNDDYKAFTDAVVGNLDPNKKPTQFNFKVLYRSNMIIVLFNGYAPYIIPLLREENRSAKDAGRTTNWLGQVNLKEHMNINFNDLPYFNDKQLSPNNDECYNISTFFGMLDMLRYEKAKINKYTFPSVNSSYVLQSQGNVPLGMILYADSLEDAQSKFEAVLQQQYILQNAGNKMPPAAPAAAPAAAQAVAEKKDNMNWIGLTPVEEQYLPTVFKAGEKNITHLLAKWVPAGEYFNSGIPGKWMVMWNKNDLEKIKDILSTSINNASMKKKVMIFANVQESQPGLGVLNKFKETLNTIFTGARQVVFSSGLYDEILGTNANAILNNPRMFRTKYDIVKSSTGLFNKTNNLLLQNLFVLGVLKNFIVWFPENTRYGEKKRNRAIGSKEQSTYESGWYFIDTFTKVDTPSDFPQIQTEFLENVKTYGGTPTYYSAQLGNPSPAALPRFDANSTLAELYPHASVVPAAAPQSASLLSQAAPPSALFQAGVVAHQNVGTDAATTTAMKPSLLNPVSKGTPNPMDLEELTRQQAHIVERLKIINNTLKVKPTNKNLQNERVKLKSDNIKITQEIQQIGVPAAAAAAAAPAAGQPPQQPWQAKQMQQLMQEQKVRNFIQSMQHVTPDSSAAVAAAAPTAASTLAKKVQNDWYSYQSKPHGVRAPAAAPLRRSFSSGDLGANSAPLRRGAFDGGARKYPAKKYRFASRKHSKRCKTTSHKKACRRKSHKHTRITRKR